MKLGPDISSIAALIGDPARANILTALISGCALTATELTVEAGVTKQTTSSHLAKLVMGNFLKVEKQGRHKYYRLANREIANLLEILTNVAADLAPKRVRMGPKEPALRKARRCYDHLAGDLAVKLLDGFLAQKLLVEDGDSLKATPKGIDYFDRFGIDMKKIIHQKRPTCLACLDWSVRRPHLAGGLGAALLSKFETLGWATKFEKSRIIEFSKTGEANLIKMFDLTH